MMAAMPISDDMAQVIEGGGAAAWLATSSPERRPTAARVLGASFVRGRDRLALFVPTEQSGRTLANVEHGSQLAVFFCRVTDYRSIQIKGTLVASRPAREDERDYQRRYMAAWTEACTSIGLSRDLMERLAYWPSIRLEIDVTASFEQTPGPRAGVAL
jgi:hypothetical protein